ncbi:hypothetical protein BGZ63DRAFT_427094 [Mariannaea sp. PMI_226]|nr:hypothetical protein BGZ63DRAFT_427094 [Mariannaea sp. PMI_226]
MGYLLVNTLLCVTNVTMAKLSNPAARFGWMAAANIALAVFLGIRNTPLASLTKHTYNDLNVLHRVIGYTVIAQVILHTIFYIMRFGAKNRWDIFINRPNLEGIFSGVGTLILLSGLLRHRGYETFLISHILGAVATILFAGLHRPAWRQKIPIIMIAAAIMWLLDRLIRVGSLLRNLHESKATLYSLPNGGIRLVLNGKHAKGTVPGTYVFVWIPSIGLTQTHPFTVVGNTKLGLEMVIKAHRGFTQDIYKYAVSNPGSAVKASFEGPYGSLPSLEHYDRIIFIAGGSGAAFTFGLVNTLLETSGPGSSQLVTFLWSVRNKENLTWFSRHLDNLSSHLSTRVSMTLYVTEEFNFPPYQDFPGNTTPDLGATEASFSQIPQGAAVESLRLAPTASRLTQHTLCSRLPWDDASNVAELDIKYGINYERLRVREAILGAIQHMGTNQRVLVAACGPESMMQDVRAATGDCIRSNGPSVDVHCENFNW